MFLVSQAEREDYRLRFEDDSVQSVRAEDLPRYGSQVLADAGEMPQLNQIIRWIEVDVPVRFLPDGVSLVDTPGLGSLYAAHDQITQRFLPHADAVIYTLDSTQPLGDYDLKALDAILDVTPHIFFIQTRIDQVNRDAWQALQRRNEEILHDRFGTRLTDPRVWPISSVNLMKAAETGDEDYEMVSRHRELAAALKGFLFRVAGLSRVAMAVMIAGQYQGTGQQVLAGRIADLVEQSRARREAIQQQVTQRRQQFDTDWGEQGPKSQALMAMLQQATSAGRQSLHQALEPGGEIEQTLCAKINRLTTLEQARHLSETLASEVTQAAVKQWQAVDQQVRGLCLNQLGPFAAAMDHLAQASYVAASLPERYELQTEDNWFDKAKGFRTNFTQALALTGLGGSAAAAGWGAATSTTLTHMLASSLFPPLAIGLAIAAGIWALLQGERGYQRVEETQLKQAQQELHRHLHESRERVRRYYFDVNLGAGRVHHLVDEHFGGQMRRIVTEVQRLARQKSEEARLELARLTDQFNLDEQQRAARLAGLRSQSAQWNQVGQDIQGVIQDTETLEKAFVAIGNPG
ncbi:Dynamin N-terminal domain-containing protein [Gammaproteobacteria bacterium]